MKSKTKILVSIPVATTAVGVPLFFRWANKLLMDRFPEIDPVVVRKAFRRMMFKSLTNQYPDISDYSDRQMDEIFKAECCAIIHP